MELMDVPHKGVVVISGTEGYKLKPLAEDRNLTIRNTQVRRDANNLSVRVVLRYRVSRGRRAEKVKFMVVLSTHEVIKLSVESVDDKTDEREKKKVVRCKVLETIEKFRFR